MGLWSLWMAGCAGAPAAALPADAGPGDGADAGEAVDAGPPVVAAAGLVQQVARSSCGALFRCCDAASRQRYFANYQSNVRLAALATRFPPADEAACGPLLEEALAIIPLGLWLQAVDAGAVTFDGAAAAACLATLDRAACGAPVRDALFDGRCFGFNSPAGGQEQRAMFLRTAVDGTPCRSLNDGIGGSFYGTCDPREAFCCYERPGVQGCALASSTGEGTCRAVSAEGEACGVSPLQLCATGVDCDTASGTCRTPAGAALALGQPCADASFNLLGDCVEGWCDLLGARTCQQKKAEGTACFGPDECAGGDCVLARCAVNSLCEAP
ncbi:MAG: hypothetical protein FJ086_20585 [Deltaproteobacteria bacterium]|nr:hypothetical protein [Deltaproteobacteria bacterium]